MEKKTFTELGRGDIIRHKIQHKTYVVVANDGSNVTIVDAKTITAKESAVWELSLKASHLKF